MSGNSAAFIGSVPKDYDEGLGPILFAGYARMMAERAAAGQAARILETACGTGIVTRQLRDHLPSAHLTVTDPNTDMLALARQKLNADQAVKFEQADATALPFSDASFDMIVCQFGIMFYPDRDKGFREAHRVLCTGGRYLFSVWDAHEYNLFGRIAHTAIGSFFETNPPQFYVVPFSCHAVDPIKHALIRVGFTDIVVSVLRRQQTVKDFGALAHGVIFGSPVREQISQRGGDLETVRDYVASAFRAEFGQEPATMPMQAILFEARKA